MRLLLTLMLLATVTAGAQTIGQNKTPGSEETFTLTVKSQLVIETVVVKDKKGNSIDGLTAKDFTLTEDGIPQTIRFCEHQTLPTTPEVIPPTTLENEDIKIYRRLARTQISLESPDKAKYKDRRLLAMYFDMTAMRPDDQLRALTAAEKFIRTQMTTADLVSILRYEGGSVDVLQDFTQDRNKLLSVLQT